MPTYFLRKEAREAILKIDYCAYCGSAHSLTVDHIVPRSKGGTGSLTNLTRACQRCNRFKSDFDVNTFLSRMFDKRDEGLDKFYGYSNRLKLHRKRKTHPELREWLVRKIGEIRSDNSYYSAVIGSILRGKFKIF